MALVKRENTLFFNKRKATTFADEEIIKKRDQRLVQQLLAEANEIAPEERAGLEEFVSELLIHDEAKTIVSYLVHRRLAEAPKNVDKPDMEEAPTGEGAPGKPPSKRRRAPRPRPWSSERSRSSRRRPGRSPTSAPEPAASRSPWR